MFSNEIYCCVVRERQHQVKSSNPYLESVCDLNKCNLGFEPQNRHEKEGKGQQGVLKMVDGISWW